MHFHVDMAIIQYILAHTETHTHPNTHTGHTGHTYTHTQFQQIQVAKFCSKYNLNGARLILPRRGSPSQQVLFRHLLLNDKTQTMFCFAPKVLEDSET